MGLLGNGWDDPQSSAIMALAGGLLQGNFGAGLLGANNAFAQAKNAALERDMAVKRMGLLDAQIDETKAQAKEREAKVEAGKRAEQSQRDLIYGSGGGMATGAFQPAADGYGPVAPTSEAGGGLLGLARRYGIPEQAIQADIAFNGGKKISEFLAERTKPNWQNINGNLVNTNAQGFQGGFQPGMSASNDGKVTMWQPDGQGGLVVGAPNGALQTYGAYKGIDAGVNAQHDLVKVVGPDGAERWLPRSTVLAAQQPQVPPPSAPTQPQSGQRTPLVMSGDGDRYAILTQELQKAQAAGNAGDVAALQREIGRLPAAARTMPSASGLAVPQGFQASPTSEQAAAAAAARERAVADAKAAAGRADTDAKRKQSMTDMVRNLGVAESLLKRGPTESGAGAIADKVSGFFGTTTSGAQLASSLESISGWLTSNVPRMEGPQSDKDVANYAVQAGRVGDRTLPVAERLASLQVVRDIVNKYSGEQGDTKPATPQGQTFDAMPKASPANKDKFLTDTSTGKRYRSNGLSWVEVK